MVVRFPLSPYLTFSSSFPIQFVLHAIGIMSLLPDSLHEEIENDVSPDHPTEGTNPSGGERLKAPSLSTLGILQKATTDNIFLLGYDEICRRLYDGFLLHDKEKKVAEKKFWVCKKSYKNCVLVLSKAMDITWSENSEYWDYIDEKEECFDGEMDIPVAKLKWLTWLDVNGKLKTMVLSPKTTYDVAFVVKMMRGTSSRWFNPVSVNLRLPDGSMQERKENLRNKPEDEWFNIPIGSFVTSAKNFGELSFQLNETESSKSGLLIKGVLLQPRD